MKKISIFLMMLCLGYFGVAKAQQSLPYTYGFEDNDLAIDGWTTQNPSGLNASGFGISTYAKKTGNYGFRFSSYNDAGVQTQYLISPELNAANGVVAQFYYKASSTSGTELFKVGYSTTDTEISSFTFGTEISTSSTSWTQSEEFTFPAGTKYVAIYYYSNWQYYLFVDDFTFDEAPTSCLKPFNLAATTDGATATVTWNGNATNDFIIDINGTQTSGVTSPYTFEVALSTTYNISVIADCGEGNTSDPASITLKTPPCLSTDMCSITLELNNVYGLGWTGDKMQVIDANTGEVYGTYSLIYGIYSATYELELCPGTNVNFVYTRGIAPDENGWTIYDPAGEIIDEHTAGSTAAPNGIQATYTMECSGCFKPKNLQASDITLNSATLSWTGNSDSYVLQYRPWSPTGDDVIPTGELQRYQFDLSQFSGTGAIVIRHYDVTNMHRLNIDDIVVYNADNQVIYSQNFENCGGNIPSEFTMMDMDGDGQNWYVFHDVNNGNTTIHGSYGLSSASYNNGPLFPDNWLVLSGIELGGSITFYACGQDLDLYAENFNVYVCPDNALVEEAVNGTTYDASGLLPYTPVTWQVKSICGEGDESGYASSFFSTLDEFLIFGVEGDWNELSNWTDMHGEAITALPTIADKVRIDEDVTIPADVVAEAKKATLNGGTITIADGGQLKLKAIVEVTMQKEITGWSVEGYTYENGEIVGKPDGYYFISTPLTTTRLTPVTGRSYVNATENAGYDLYTFDPTEEVLEWINYKDNPSHANFTSSSTFDPVFVSMLGYLYANATDMTLEFEGLTAYPSVNNSKTLEYTYDDESTDYWNGWQLVGNPFTCDATISYINDFGEILPAVFYKMNDDGDGLVFDPFEDNYATLPPLAGAFVNFSETGKIQFSSEIDDISGNDPIGNGNIGKGLIGFKLSQGRNKVVDQGCIRFGRGYNLKHLSFRRNSSKVYMPVDGNDYAVVYTENQGEMPVSFKAENNGTYTLSFNTNNAKIGYLHLIDNMTGNDVDLLSTPSYSFEARTTDYANRFKLVFASGSSTSSDTFAFYSNGSFVINNEGNATLQVIDVTGRILSSENINGCANVNVNATPGVYMLRLVNGDNVKVQKVVVR